jgi:predicted nucleic acid-binding protein
MMTGDQSLEITAAFEVPSDHLATVRDVLELFPIVAQHLPRPESIRVVIDANVVIADILWLSSKRSKVGARTALLEALASGTLVALAPSYLQTEMVKKLHAASIERNISEERMLVEWNEYRALLHFVDADLDSNPTSSAAVIDPKDVPYLVVYDRLGAAAVMTDDAHLALMGAKTVRAAEIRIALRDYARAAAVEMNLKVNGVFVTVLGIEMVKGVLKMIRSCFGQLQKLPIEVRMLLGSLVVLALLHQSTRERLRSLAIGVLRSVMKGAEAALPLYAELDKLAKNKEADRRRAWSAVAVRVQPRRAPLRAHVLALLVGANEPLSEDQIAIRLGQLGIKISAPSFRRSLRAILRKQPELREISPRTWSVAKPAVA